VSRRKIIVICPRCQVAECEIDSFASDERMWGDQDQGEPLVCPYCYTSLWLYFHARGNPMVMTADQRQQDIQRRQNLPPNRPAATAGWPKF
jgi:hypothetical protein